MSHIVLICDDSTLARKQLARALPEQLKRDVRFACNGKEAMEQLRRGGISLMFLDLTMPEMDGYQTLTAIIEEQIDIQVIAVSGDIQPAAVERVMSLGAIGFIKKPFTANAFLEKVHEFGLILNEDDNQPITADSCSPATSLVCQAPGDRDVYQEVANISMGRAADSLARLLDVFVILPIPNVNVFEVSELEMALCSIVTGKATSGVCQGFIGEGIAGEALLILNDSSFADLAKLMKYGGEINKIVELELLLDISNILIGAFLDGLAEQIDLKFSQAHPVILGQHLPIKKIIQLNKHRWRQTLSIEMSYGISNYPIQCDLLFLFTEDSVTTFNNKLAYLHAE